MASETPDIHAPAELSTHRSVLRRAAWTFGAVAVVVSVGAAVVAQTGALPADVEWRFAPGWLALALTFLVLLPVIQAELWRRILRELGAPLPPREAWVICNLAMLGRYVPTQLLSVAIRLAMAGREGVPRRVTVASTAYELALQAAAAAVVGAVAFLQLPGVAGEPWRWAVLALPVAGVVALHPLVFGRFAGIIVRRLGVEELPSTLSFAQILRFGAAYVGSFVVAGLGVLCFVRALHAVPTEDVPLVVGAWALGFVGSVVAFVLPGGIGVRDGAIAGVLVAVVPAATAVAAAIALRLVQTGIELLLAAVSLVYARGLPEFASSARGRGVSGVTTGRVPPESTPAADPAPPPRRWPRRRGSATSRDRRG